MGVVSRLAATLGPMAVAGILGCGDASGRELYTKSLFDLALQKPKAKVIDSTTRRHFVLKEVYDRNCSCFSGLFLDDQPIAMNNDPESPGIVASKYGLFLIGEFETRACPYHYFVLSFRHPIWPDPVRSEAFGDCTEPRSITFDTKGGISIRFSRQIITFRDGKLGKP